METETKIITRYSETDQMGIIIYQQTAAYGHFGRNDLNLPWEKLDKVCTFKKYTA